ncbi:complex 1 protein (LYR family) domain-containing protein [Sarocladium implicatum]|nr:complex 1 protein (LYR family) domain-containing protein [Sarocladium implicatum]
MLTNRFVPAHDQRHRSAVLALYRALLRLSGQITISTESQHSTRVNHAISQRIRSRFDANRSCWSTRLIYAALAAGYQVSAHAGQFVDVLSKARDLSSPEYARVLNYVQSRPSTRSRSRPKKPTRRLSSSSKPSLLTPITHPDGTVSYIPTVPPEQDPRWAKGRLPQMGKTAEDMVFLRMRRPQPFSLTQKLIKKRRQTTRQVDIVKRIDTDDMASARDEDHWESLLKKEMSLEGLGQSWMADDMEASYRWSVALSQLWLAWRWERSHLDNTARGEALAALVDAVVDMRNGKTDAVRTAPRAMRSMDGNSGEHLPSNVKVGAQSKYFPLSAALQHLGCKTPSGKEVDPFIEPSWTLLAQNQHHRVQSAIPGFLSEQGATKGAQQGSSQA